MGINKALASLHPAQHRLNLTIRANIMARRQLFAGTSALGVEAESGGKSFPVEGEQIILSAGAIASPHPLQLSGVWPVAQLSSKPP